MTPVSYRTVALLIMAFVLQVKPANAPHELQPSLQDVPQTFYAQVNDTIDGPARIGAGKRSRT